MFVGWIILTVDAVWVLFHFTIFWANAMLLYFPCLCNLGLLMFFLVVLSSLLGRIRKFEMLVDFVVVVLRG